MRVGVIKDYKLRDLRASHSYTGLVVELEHLKKRRGNFLTFFFLLLPFKLNDEMKHPLACKMPIPVMMNCGR
jgi:hypothetical protein